MSALMKTSVFVALLLLARTATAADELAAGKIKSMDADSKKFVVTDSAGKDSTFTFADKYMVNRGGNESKGELNVGDAVLIHFDKGLVNWSAKYILVQEGESMNWAMNHGNFKGYDSTTKHLTFTNPEGGEVKVALGNAAVQLNFEKADVSELKIGDHVLVINDGQGKPDSLKFLIAERD